MVLKEKDGGFMYRIGMFSKLGKTTIKTLRYYDEVGILKPSYVDEENNYRYYTTEQLFSLHEIVALRQLGFSIPEISDILNGHNVSGILEQRKAEMESEISSLTDQLFRLSHYQKTHEEGLSMKYQPVVKEIPEYIVMSKRVILSKYSDLMTAMPAMGESVRKANPALKCVEPEYCFNIYHDGEYKEADIDVELCQAVENFGVESDGVIFKKVPATTVVSVMHKGAYEDLGGAYAFALQWIKDNNYTIASELRESYINGIWNKDSVEDWLTEIQVPIIAKN